MARGARRVLVQAAIVVLVAIAGLVARAALSGGARGGDGWAGGFPAAPVSRATRFSAAAAMSRRVPAGTSLIATVRGAVARVHDRPRSGAEGSRLLRRRRVGGFPVPLTFLVLGRRPGWVRVALPVRPNGATGWVRRGAVRLTATSLAVGIELAAHRLVVRDRGRVVLRTRIGVGRAVSPTPHGRYFVTDVIRTGRPHGFYGPYAIGLSAHSSVYTTFEGGDGQIGIHGTNQPRGLGRDVSHGCIRVPNAVIRRLARRLPLGTPVAIAR